jgi:hypothetical protein
MTCLWELSAIATAACEASDVSLHVVMDRHVCASENGMLSDLSVTWEGFTLAKPISEHKHRRLRC